MRVKEIFRLYIFFIKGDKSQNPLDLHKFYVFCKQHTANKKLLLLIEIFQTFRYLETHFIGNSKKWSTEFLLVKIIAVYYWDQFFEVWSLCINSFYMNKRPEINFNFMLLLEFKVRRILYFRLGLWHQNCFHFHIITFLSAF
jgi:hypothetical protein